ncbi:MAG: Lrp/AsnC family transcriptional regulator [Pseudomonadota bacterium]
MLDDTDRRLLRYWQADPSLTPAELAAKAGGSAAQVTRRIARLRDRGIVEGVEAAINWAALGYTVEVSLRITLDKTVPRAFDEFIVQARQVPHVLEIQTFLGRVDLRLKVIARDMSDYQDIYRSQILNLPHIADIEALMHLVRTKSDPGLPL